MDCNCQIKFLSRFLLYALLKCLRNQLSYLENLLPRPEILEINASHIILIYVTGINGKGAVLYLKAFYVAILFNINPYTAE